MIVFPTNGKSFILPTRQPSATLGIAVGDHLHDAIVTGALVPGSPLKEQDLAAKLGISSTPIREALTRLAAIGLVEIVSNTAKRVAPLNLEQALDVLGIHSLLLTAAYRVSMKQMNAIVVKRLHFQVDTIIEAAQRGDEATALAAAGRFDSILLDLSGSMEASRIILSRRSYLSRHIILSCPEFIRDGLSNSYVLSVDAIENLDISQLLQVRKSLMRELRKNFGRR